MVEAEDKFAALRTQIFTESLVSSNDQPRWGYFGIPGSLAIGDNSYAPKMTKKPVSEDDGELIRNVQTAPCKKGSGVDVYFKFETPLALGDPYNDPGLVNKKGKVTMLDPDANFKPPGSVRRSINKLGYEYEPHCDSAKDPKAVKEKYMEWIPPRNIFGNPAKKGGGGVLTGGVLFGFAEPGAFPEHMPDDYDSAKKMRRKELDDHHAKEQESAFKGMDYGNKNFHPYGDVYGGFDVPTHIPRDPLPDRANKYPHETPFRPSNPMKKDAMGCLLGALPEHMPDPPDEVKRKPPPADDAPPAFKLGASRQTTNPMPSVTTLTRNMRAERPSSFMRPSL